MKSFEQLSEKEVLALAISLAEEDESPFKAISQRSEQRIQFLRIHQ